MPKVDGRGLKCGINHVIADHGDWVAVDVSTRRAPNAVLKISSVDWKYLSGDGFGRWRACPHRKTAYVETDRSPFGARVRIHSMILGRNRIIDHINHDGLDNRRQNLRIVTPTQNAQNRRISTLNTSGIVGVSWRATRARWQVNIGVEGRLIFIGHFIDLQEAISARLDAEKRYFGDYRNKELEGEYATQGLR